MPIGRLILILVLVIVMAAATIAVALAVVDALAVSPMVGLASVSVIALCASFALRRFTQRKMHDHR